MCRLSPFRLTSQEEQFLATEPSLQILRKHLGQTPTDSFCSAHQDLNDDEREEWLLHRDLTHALIAPILQLFNRASVLAEALTKTRVTDDLELAFRGDARGAFIWLQCFFADESSQWSVMQKCPACTVLSTLYSDSTIRLTIAACLVSSLQKPNTPNKPTLPSLDFFLRPLEAALYADPFWGADIYEYIYPKAEILATGIKDLIQQYHELASLATCPAAVSTFSRSRNLVAPSSYFTSSPSGAESPITPTSPTSPQAEEGAALILRPSNRDPIAYSLSTNLPTTCMRIKKSKLARRQMKMQAEEQALMRQWIWTCWRAVCAPEVEVPTKRFEIERRGKMKREGSPGEGGRKRSRTGP